MLQSLLLGDLEEARALLSGGHGLRVGHRGATVKAVQFALDALGYRLPVSVRASPLAADGEFGKETCAAVQAFQRQNGLAADGIVGRFTISALDQALIRQRADPLEAAVAALRRAFQRVGEAAIAGESGYGARDVAIALAQVDALTLGSPMRAMARMNRLARAPNFA